MTSSRSVSTTVSLGTVGFLGIKPEDEDIDEIADEPRQEAAASPATPVPYHDKGCQRNPRTMVLGYKSQLSAFSTINPRKAIQPRGH